MSEESATVVKFLMPPLIPPDGVKRKFYGVVDSVPPDKIDEVLDGELNHEQWDENDSENFTDSDDSHILLKRERTSVILVPF